jgi:hypothetical protein
MDYVSQVSLEAQVIIIVGTLFECLTIHLAISNFCIYITLTQHITNYYTPCYLSNLLSSTLRGVFLGFGIPLFSLLALISSRFVVQVICTNVT